MQVKLQNQCRKLCAKQTETKRHKAAFLRAVCRAGPG